MQASINQALLSEWDPIGIKGITGAEDEYNGYVPAIHKMLLQKRTKEDIFDYLWWIETERMGLSGNRQATIAFANRLLSLASDE